MLLPVLPWTDGDGPPNITYGIVRGVPVLNMNCWVGYGLCATDTLAIPLNRLKQAQLRPNFGSRSVPDVVHALKPLPTVFYTIAGQTLDSAGNPLGSCVATLFSTSNDLLRDKTISDASGNYNFKSAYRGRQYYVVFYKVGSPDVAGTTVNTLVGV